MLGYEHIYCRECLIALFEAAVRDPDLFSPRYCRNEIPLKKVNSQFFTREFSERFSKKYLEITTPSPVQMAVQRSSRQRSSHRLHCDMVQRQYVNRVERTLAYFFD
jgi:hypothetical protein